MPFANCVAPNFAFHSLGLGRVFDQGEHRDFQRGLSFRTRCDAWSRQDFQPQQLRDNTV